MNRKMKTVIHAEICPLFVYVRGLVVGACILAALFQASPAHGQLIVANMWPTPGSYEQQGRITFYNRGDSGDVAPQRVIEGPATGLDFPMSVAVDTENRELFVNNNAALTRAPTITVYDLDVEGNVAPKRTLVLDWINPEGIAVDPVNDELYVFGDFGYFLVFERTASGEATPLRRLNESIGLPGDVVVDPLNDELFLQPGAGIIRVYARTASGDDPPIREIAGDLDYYHTLAVDSLHDELIVAGNGAVRIYPRSWDGNVEPLRVIEGPLTGLFEWSRLGVGLDLNLDTIFVTRKSGECIAAFPRTSDGDVAPVRTISGDSTKLASPFDVAVVMSTDLTGSGMVFSDGFESGDVSRWSDEVP